jgi:hypothetical protein
MEAKEAINDCSKFVAQAIDSLKFELRGDLPSEWDHEGNIKEVIGLLEQVLEKLTAKI